MSGHLVLAIKEMKTGEENSGARWGGILSLMVEA